MAFGRGTKAGIAGGIGGVILTAWTAIKFVLDSVGRVQVVTDAKKPDGLVVQFLLWLSHTPYWVPGGLTAVLVIGLLRYLHRSEESVLGEQTSKERPLPVPSQADLQQPVNAELNAEIVESRRKLSAETNSRIEWQQKSYDLERTLETSNAERDAALDEAVTERSRAEESARELRWKIDYRMDRPNVPPLSREHTDTARLEIARLASAFEGLGKTLQPLVEELVSRCDQRGAADFSFWFSELFQSEVLRPCSKALALVQRPETVDSREAFIGFFQTYKRFREWLPRVAFALDIDEAELTGYAAWRESDAKFFGELDRIPSVPPLKGLRDFVRDQNGYPQNLNRTATENPVLRRLMFPSADEAAFLELFCIDRLPMDREKPETWLSNAIFRASAGLVKHRVLTQTIAAGKERFCLTPTASAVWPRSGLAKRPLQRCIDIDPNVVRGTGASGGGARGGSSP